MHNKYYTYIMEMHRTNISEILCDSIQLENPDTTGNI